MEAEKYLKEHGGAVNIHIEPNDAVYIKEDCTYRLMEDYHQAKLKLLGIANVSDTLIAWEQFKKANWYESEAIDVEKMLMDKFQAIYGRLTFWLKNRFNVF